MNIMACGNSPQRYRLPRQSSCQLTCPVLWLPSLKLHQQVMHTHLDVCACLKIPSGCSGADCGILHEHSGLMSLTSKAPAPKTVDLSSRVFLTARKPSLAASLIWAKVWSAGPFSRMVQEVGFRTSSTKVYLSSPRTCSYTLPANLQGFDSRGNCN